MYKKIISLLLAAIMTIGCMTGCTQSTSKEIKIEKKNVKETIEETNIVFVKDGNSDFAIVVPASATYREQTAAEELQYFVEEATGAKLQILSETDASSEGKYIYIGATEAAEQAGVKPTYDDFQYNGFVIKQKDDDLYLRGYFDIGTLNAVYEFIDYAFDYEFYAYDEIHLTETKNANMLAFDLEVVPDFDWRWSNYGEIINNETISNRMRMNSAEDCFVTGYLTHSSFEIIDPFDYDWNLDAHKGWFSEAMWNGMSGGVERPAQLCYSNDDMRREFTKNLIELVRNSSAPNMLLGMEDNDYWCTCEDCTAMHDKYGTDSAVMVTFVNKVQAEVNAWYKENLPEVEPPKLILFAYKLAVNPPAKYNEEAKKWEPIDEEVVLNPDSGVYFCPISARYDIPFTANEISDVSEPYGQTLGWGAISKNLYAWTYSLYMHHAPVTFNSIEVMQENYQFLLDNGVTMIQDQTDHYQKNINSGYSRLKAYLMAELQWDTTLNMKELIDDFCEAYFGPAGDTMKNLIKQEREWYTYLNAEVEKVTKIGFDIVDERYWSYNQLRGYMNLIDQAYKEIETLRDSDPERYATLYDRILLESLQYRYLMLNLFYTEYDEATLAYERKAFRADFERLGLTRHDETGKIEDLWSEWGVE